MIRDEATCKMSDTAIMTDAPASWTSGIPAPHTSSITSTSSRAHVNGDLFTPERRDTATQMRQVEQLRQVRQTGEVGGSPIKIFVLVQVVQDPEAGQAALVRLELAPVLTHPE